MTASLHLDNNTWEEIHTARSLKVAVIREEFVALTGDPLMAVVLNQLLYWTQRVNDFDLLLEEEIKRNPECNVPLRHGWIYKSAEELSKETMVRLSRSTMRRYLSFLVSKGWVNERANPYKWNKTTQYRLNLSNLQEDLLALGYCLPGFSLPLKKDGLIIQKPRELSNGQNETSREQTETSTFQNDPSNVQNCSSIYLNRDYTEITNREHTQTPLRGSARKENDFLKEGLSSPHRPASSASKSQAPDKNKQNSLAQQAVEIWKHCIGQDKIHLTDSRSQRLTILLNEHFESNLREWEKFCERVKASKFLMGQGVNKWRVTFDWILTQGNVLKVLEGNYDSPEILEQKNKHLTHQTRDLEIRKTLDSIEDAQWKYWCTQLSRSFSREDNPPHKETFANDFISVGDLKDISQARFLEFDGRLVWIESADPKTLSRIEDLRLIILSVIQHTYPQARNVRTQKEEIATRRVNSFLFEECLASKESSLESLEQESSCFNVLSKAEPVVCSQNFSLSSIK